MATNGIVLLVVFLVYLVMVGVLLLTGILPLIRDAFDMVKDDISNHEWRAYGNYRITSIGGILTINTYSGLGYLDYFIATTLEMHFLCGVILYHYMHGELMVILWMVSLFVDYIIYTVMLFLLLQIGTLPLVATAHDI